ncbi:MAG: DUF484 family protein [Pelagibacteraceae bacterium]|jgi:uncharacterized protein YigA (DUF484 family)|nr:DUF484 family protein [Pelagibacteraceae bacterium]MBT3902532.1 DUF484 family protein [Pelagibacteraceae bacterium]MBT4646113.1 DUF484 family protein [Pelagibacteraceae bacterium]MBT4951389.1 DUF484 family protein [Pelagibacteraceae bacterium]MBT5214163.1 DUF484 family protein [Pelagibacteraceae bacterium]
MKRKDENSSAEDLVQNFLKKNKNFFLKHPELLKELQFPLKDESSDKVIDLQVYRYKKINQENIDIQNQMTQILLAGKSHMQSQKRILKSSLKILNCKSLAKVFSVILSDFKLLLGCEYINCFSTNDSIDINEIQKIDARIAKSYFREKAITNLNQNPKGVLLYFPNKSQQIKSYILLKINFQEDMFVVAMGSKDINKFNPDQQVDLIEYLIKIIEIKINQL